MAYGRAKVAVFYDSCFWHACPTHGRQPRVNDWYWGPKLARTVERDRQTTSALEAHGWTVVRIWEHEHTDQAIRRIVEAVQAAKRARSEHEKSRPVGHQRD